MGGILHVAIRHTPNVLAFSSLRVVLTAFLWICVYALGMSA